MKRVKEQEIRRRTGFKQPARSYLSHVINPSGCQGNGQTKTSICFFLLSSPSVCFSRWVLRGASLPLTLSWFLLYPDPCSRNVRCCMVTTASMLHRFIVGVFLTFCFGNGKERYVQVGAGWTTAREDKKKNDNLSIFMNPISGLCPSVSFRFVWLFMELVRWDLDVSNLLGLDHVRFCCSSHAKLFGRAELPGTETQMRWGAGSTRLLRWLDMFWIA